MVILIGALQLSGALDLLGSGSSRSGGSSSGGGGQGSTDGLQQFIIGAWGQDNDCGDLVTFEAGGRLLIAREGEGTWSLRQENGRDILVAELGGNRQEASVVRVGDGMEMTQSSGNELQGTYARCQGGSPGSGQSEQSSGGGQPPATAVPPEVGRWLVGRWTTGQYCTRVLEFRADGSLTNANGSPGRWSYQDTDPSTMGAPHILTMVVGGQTVQAVTHYMSAGEAELRPQDGSPPFRITRCP